MREYFGFASVIPGAALAACSCVVLDRCQRTNLIFCSCWLIIFFSV